MHSLTIDVWSDIACPWCYVGKRRLEAALRDFAHGDAVRLTWRSFELDPSAARVLDMGTAYEERLAKKYRMSTERARQMIASMTQTAAVDGIEMRFDHIQPGNTFDAHRLLHLAALHGVQDALKERLFRAYLTDGDAIGEPDTLLEAASDVGLDVDEVQGVLSSDAFAKEVREEQAQAATLGIHGVPFFVIDGRYAVEGAQPSDVLLKVLERVWAENVPAVEAPPGAAICGPQGCT